MTAEFVPCPKCGSDNVKRVSYTWWGGALGPRLFNHVRCGNCGNTYNGKTGNSNVPAILTYTVVIMILVIIAYYLISTIH